MEAYNEVFDDYEKKAYIQRLPKSKVKEQWFLLHFPVIKLTRETTKVRVVFDAVMKW